MNRTEIINQIQKTKANILNILEQSGIKSPSARERQYNILIANFYYGFYDSKTANIKKSINLSSKEGLTSSMPTNHLEYKLKFLKNVVSSLEGKYSSLYEIEGIEALITLSLGIAKKTREEFKNTYHIIPITDLKKSNKTNFITELTKSLKDDSLTKEDLRYNIDVTREILLINLPTIFNNPKAYREILGIYNMNFYDTSASELLERLHRVGNKTSNKTIYDFMDNNHLKYYYTGLSYIQMFIQENEKDYESLKKKVTLVSSALKDEFYKTNQKQPRTDIIEINNVIKKRQYEMQNISSVEQLNFGDICSDIEQLSFEDYLQRTRQ